MPPEDRGRLHDHTRFPQSDTPGQQDQRKAQRSRRPARVHLPLAVQGQLLPKEQNLRCERRPRSECSPKNIRPSRLIPSATRPRCAHPANVPIGENLPFLQAADQW